MTYGEWEELKKKIEQMTAVTDEVWTMDELSKQTGYAKQSIYNMISRNEIPVHKGMGRKPLFLKSEIIRWIRNH